MYIILIGFMLICVGLVFLVLKGRGKITDTDANIETGFFKLKGSSGIVLVALGVFIILGGQVQESDLSIFLNNIIDENASSNGEEDERTDLTSTEGPTKVTREESTDTPEEPVSPTITWNPPASITYGTALGRAQLNAAASDHDTGNTVLGTFVYSPAEGTKLGVGTHELHVDFTPDDTANYNEASKDVTINVLPKTYAYITNYDDNSISVVDIGTNTVIYTVKEGVGDGPCDVAFTPDGKKAYVPNRRSNSVSVIDTNTKTVIYTVKEGVGDDPYDVAFTPDGKKAYIPNRESNTVSVIDTATNTVVYTVTEGIGNDPTGVAVTSDGKKAYVTNHGDTNISVIDTTSNAVIDHVQVGDSPWGVAVSPDESKAYVTNDMDKTISVIDTETDSVVVDVPINNNYPGGIAVNSEETRAYVTSGKSDIVSIIDTATNTVIDTVPVGNLPWGIAVSPDGSKVCVTNYNDNSISIIDTTTNNVVGIVKVGDEPCGVAFVPD